MARQAIQLRMRFRQCAFLLAVYVALSGIDTARGQDLGHKLPGLIGLDAGTIPEPGLYLLDRFVLYEASELRDTMGQIIPVGELRLEALSNAVGVSYTIKFPQTSISLTATAAGPIARFRLNVQDRPETSFDRFGLADFYIQPARLGWRQDHFDLIGSYGLYLPSGLSPLAGGKGVSFRLEARSSRTRTGPTLSRRSPATISICASAASISRVETLCRSREVLGSAASINWWKRDWRATRSGKLAMIVARTCRPSFVEHGTASMGSAPNSP
jgi:hypothetical protein